jgi:anti-sigma B factor antagonist
MQVKTEDKNGIMVCYVDGEVNLNTSPQLKKAFDKIVETKAKKVVINFGSVSYIDSSGLATIVEIFKKLRAYGGALKLSDMSSKIKSLFEITKLEKLFDIVEKEEDALKGFT